MDGLTLRVGKRRKQWLILGVLFLARTTMGGGFDSDRGYSPRRKRSRWGRSNLCWWIGARGIGRFAFISVIATPIQPSVKL
jgi:hypothetical protein